jgi:enamine deaminase RidA (YjgF/YER057c/UK114 family)
MSALDNLSRLGLAVPPPPGAVSNYDTWARTANLIVTSGQLPWEHGEMRFPGKLGAEVTSEQGYQAARIATLNGIAQLQQASGGLDRIARIVRVEGNVHCAPGFRDHPAVLDGCSDLLVAVFGDRGRHTRTAVGIAEMPLNACVQLSFWAELRS